MSDLKVYKNEEVSLHNTSESTWIIMNNKVYDVTKFLLEHPGGEEVILDVAGKDATEIFNDIGHSSDAKLMAEDYLIGKVITDKTPQMPSIEVFKEKTILKDSWKGILLSPTWTNFIIPVGISIGVFIFYKLAQHFASKNYKIQI